MATEALRTNFRQAGSNSGKVTKVIKSNVEQIITTGVESKFFTPGQVGPVRFINLADFNSLLSLKTFSEYKGKIPAEKQISVSPTIELSEEPKAPENPKVFSESEQICEMCGTKTIFASDTNSSGSTQQLYLCPECGHEQEAVVLQPAKVEKKPKRRRRISSQIKTNEVK